MNDRDRERERLVSLLVMTPLSDTAGTDLRPFQNSADYLLDNGVSVELPAEPEVKPGTTGWVTKAKHDARRAIRTTQGYVCVNSDGGYVWTDAVDAFVPDPEPLTAEAVEALAEAVTFATYGARTVLDARDFALRALRESLAPYVAKGGE